MVGDEAEARSLSLSLSRCGATWFPFADAASGGGAEGGGGEGGGGEGGGGEGEGEGEGGGEAAPPPASHDAALAAARALAPERDGLRVASRKGDAVAFYNYEPSGELDTYAIHAGLPAPDVRHVAALWFHI